MIIVEERLTELSSTFPIMTISGSDYKPDFGFGTKEDLYKHLIEKAKTGGKYYPLVWLLTPIESIGSKKRIETPLSLILATLNKVKSMSNKKRIELSFKTTLIPLHDNIITAFNQSGFTRILNPAKIKRGNHYNFEFEKGESSPKDIWDAMKVEFELEMTDECLEKINY